MAIRNITESGKTQVLVGLPIKGATTINQGEIIVKDNVTGYVEVGSVATGKTCLGLAPKTHDNATGADGAALATSVYGGDYVVMENSTGADKVLTTDMFSTVYINGANKVSRLSAGKSAAGKCVGFEPSGDVRVLVLPF